MAGCAQGVDLDQRARPRLCAPGMIAGWDRWQRRVGQLAPPASPRPPPEPHTNKLCPCAATPPPSLQAGAHVHPARAGAAARRRRTLGLRLLVRCCAGEGGAGGRRSGVAPPAMRAAGPSEVQKCHCSHALPRAPTRVPTHPRCACSRALMCALREDSQEEAELRGLLLEHELAAIMAATDRPAFALQVLSSVVAAAQLPQDRRSTANVMDNNLGQLQVRPARGVLEPPRVPPGDINAPQLARAQPAATRGLAGALGAVLPYPAVAHPAELHSVRAPCGQRQDAHQLRSGLLTGSPRPLHSLLCRHTSRLLMIWLTVVGQSRGRWGRCVGGQWAAGG